MKQNIINKVNAEGYIFKVEGNFRKVNNPDSPRNGQDFFSGKVQLALDKEGTSVVPFSIFTFEKTKSGSANRTFELLKKCVEKQLTMASGSENPIMVSINGSLSLNDFYSVANEEMISAKEIRATFVSEIRSFAKEEPFVDIEADMFINSVQIIEENEDRGIKEHTRINGAVFNDYSKEIYPFSFDVEVPDGRNYFESLGVSNSEPVFMKVFGTFKNNVKKVDVEEETAFGTPVVRTVERKTKQWIVNSATNPYDFGLEEVLTLDEVKEATQKRNIKLEKIKQEAIEYANAQKASASNNSVNSVANGEIPLF